MKKIKFLVCCILALNCNFISNADSELDQLIEKLDSVMQARGDYERSVENQLINLKDLLKEQLNWSFSIALIQKSFCDSRSRDTLIISKPLG